MLIKTCLITCLFLRNSPELTSLQFIRTTRCISSESLVYVRPERLVALTLIPGSVLICCRGYFFDLSPDAQCLFRALFLWLLYSGEAKESDVKPIK